MDKRKLYECPKCGARRLLDGTHHDRFLCGPTHHHATGVYSDSIGCGAIVFLPGRHEPGANVPVAKEVT